MPENENTNNGAPNAAANVLVRMYNVGFGDCFLLQFPAPDRPRKVLIDCGVHFSGRNPKPLFNDVIAQLIADVTENGTPTIDLLIVTHRHQDHVKGFENALWKDVEVGEVWMPWTENYNDEQALKILNKQSKKAKKLQALFSSMLARAAADGADDAKKKEIEDLKDFSENSLTNTEAMDMLHHGFKGGDSITRAYLPDRDRKKNTIKPAMLPGVTAYIMGPSFDPEVIRDMDPPANEQWFKMMEDLSSGNSIPSLPFHPDWSAAPDVADPDCNILSREDRNTIEAISDGSEFAVAKALEDSVNGTSLMIMFQIGKAFMFFPGDAQHGTWQSALKDEEWRELLTKTNFYKIGHHGSHNSTPKEFVHKVLQPDSNCKAMASVYPVKKFKEIPKDTLIEDLIKLPVQYVRSDTVGENGDPDGFSRTDFYVETAIPI